MNRRPFVALHTSTGTQIDPPGRKPSGSWNGVAVLPLWTAPINRTTTPTTRAAGLRAV